MSQYGKIKKTAKKKHGWDQHRADIKASNHIVTDKTVSLYLAMSCLALRDEFGFGTSRMRRYINKMTDVARAISAGYLTVKDIQEQIAEEIKVLIR